MLAIPACAADAIKHLPTLLNHRFPTVRPSFLLCARRLVSLTRCALTACRFALRLQSSFTWSCRRWSQRLPKSSRRRSCRRAGASPPPCPAPTSQPRLACLTFLCFVGRRMTFLPRPRLSAVCCESSCRQHDEVHRIRLKRKRPSLLLQPLPRLRILRPSQERHDLPLAKFVVFAKPLRLGGRKDAGVDEISSDGDLEKTRPRSGSVENGRKPIRSCNSPL